MNIRIESESVRDVAGLALLLAKLLMQNDITMQKAERARSSPTQSEK
jgi:hypothetical protein